MNGKNVCFVDVVENFVSVTLACKQLDIIFF